MLASSPSQGRSRQADSCSCWQIWIFISSHMRVFGEQQATIEAVRNSESEHGGWSPDYSVWISDRYGVINLGKGVSILSLPHKHTRKQRDLFMLFSASFFFFLFFFFNSMVFSNVSEIIQTFFKLRNRTLESRVCPGSRWLAPNFLINLTSHRTPRTPIYRTTSLFLGVCIYIFYLKVVGILYLHCCHLLAVVPPGTGKNNRKKNILRREIVAWPILY